MTEQKPSSLRIFVLLLCSIFAFSILVVRLYILQIVRAPDLKENSKIARTYHLPLSPTRGLIEDRNGRPLALNTHTYTVEIDKTHTEDIRDSIQRVGSIIGLTEKEQETHIALLQTPRFKARVLKRNVPEDQKEQIEAETIPGISFKDQSVRFYPEGELAAQLIGYTGTGNRGLAGIEFAFEEKLKGIPRQITDKKDSSRRPLATDDYTKITTRGADLVLTIDSYIQYVTERELDKVRQELNALYANAVVMVPKTGEIIALANSPRFDPNQYNQFAESLRKNRLITDVYEPGSVIKPFTVVAALEYGVVTPETMFYCEHGRFYFHGRTIRDDIHSFDNLSVHDILVRSSNIGTVKIAQQLAPNDWQSQSSILYDYLNRFGFGQRIIPSLSGESPGILRQPHQWTPASIGAVPYGQEMATTTLTLATAYSALANRGIFQPPQLVKGYKTSEGQFYPRPRPEAYRIAQGQTTEQVVQMMIDVTEDPEGTGRNTRIPGFHIAAKTGTAQKVNPETGGYGRGMRIASFAGFFPAEDPLFTIVVMVDEPKKKKYGGEVAAPAWKVIAEELIAYLGISPTFTNDPLLVQANQERGKKTTKEEKLKSELDKARTFGVNKTMQISGEPRSPVKQDTMPNLIGLPIRDAYAFLAKHGLTADFQGSGKVTAQETPEGTPLEGKKSIGQIVCEPMLTDPNVDNGSGMLATR
ncbi:MAG: penicillin-binding protein [bacterium]|nr:penicillin-binding protein [bacterium]